jgi:tryptophan 2,3-dioxygenase
MTEEYGKRVPLSYNSYLRVPDLIELQGCCSDPAHHDELLFITIHQTYELWFKQILHELDAAIELIEADKLLSATRAVNRAVEIEKILVNQIHILETMTPIGFLGFREELNPASGFQSMQFREIEFVSGLKDEKILKPSTPTIMRPRGCKGDSMRPACTMRSFNCSRGAGWMRHPTIAPLHAKSARCGTTSVCKPSFSCSHISSAPPTCSLSPKVLSRMMNTCSCGALITSRWSSVCSARNPAQAEAKARAICARRSPKSSFPEFWEARTQLTPDTDKSLGCPFA